MKKIIGVVALLVTSVNTYAAALPTSYEQEVKEMVTPNVATGFYRTQNFTYDKDMNILICPRAMKYESNLTVKVTTCTDDKGNNQWRKMENSVPAGKKFVGFKSITEGYKHMIEVYWK